MSTPQRSARAPSLSGWCARALTSSRGLAGVHHGRRDGQEARYAGPGLVHHVRWRDPWSRRGPGLGTGPLCRPPMPLPSWRSGTSPPDHLPQAPQGSPTGNCRGCSCRGRSGGAPYREAGRRGSVGVLEPGGISLGSAGRQGLSVDTQELRRRGLEPVRVGDRDAGWCPHPGNGVLVLPEADRDGIDGEPSPQLKT